MPSVKSLVGKKNTSKLPQNNWFDEECKVTKQNVNH